MDPFVQGALIALGATLIAAVAGVAGAIVGAKIAAGAQRHAATLQQQETQANREEARRARFADRTRELAAQLLDSGARYDAGAAAHLEALAKGQTNVPPPNLGHTFPQVLRELQLICRIGESLVALDALEQAMGDLEAHLPEPGVRTQIDAEWLGSFNGARTEYARAAIRLTNAMRNELGATTRSGAHQEPETPTQRQA